MYDLLHFRDPNIRGTSEGGEEWEPEPRIQWRIS